MNFKSLSLLAAAGLCTLSLCGSVSAAELRVATNPTFPPKSFKRKIVYTADLPIKK